MENIAGFFVLAINYLLFDKAVIFLHNNVFLRIFTFKITSSLFLNLSLYFEFELLRK